MAQDDTADILAMTDKSVKPSGGDKPSDYQTSSADAAKMKSQGVSNPTPAANAASKAAGQGPLRSGTTVASAPPKMHKGGIVKRDGVYQLKKHEIVLPPHDDVKNMLMKKGIASLNGKMKENKNDKSKRK